MDQPPKPGDHVVHAVHGPGEVVKVTMRDTPDGPVEYVTISIEADRMQVLVPTAELGEVGIREPMGDDEVEHVLSVLRGTPLDDPGHRGRRSRNEKRLAGGEAESLAKVIRSLRQLDTDSEKPLKHRDRADLNEAMDKLVAELVISLEVDDETARAMIISAADGD